MIWFLIVPLAAVLVVFSYLDGARVLTEEK